MFELPCDACRTCTRVEFMVLTHSFPYRAVCQWCADELAVDDEEPKTDPGPSCDGCGGHGCPYCLGERGWV